jgi:Mn2+/Fe2+ NRAMP family transporter
VIIFYYKGVLSFYKLSLGLAISDWTMLFFLLNVKVVVDSLNKSSMTFLAWVLLLKIVLEVLIIFLQARYG